MSDFQIAHTERLVQKSKKFAELGNLTRAWSLLEEAHIFSQPFAGVHFYVHWEMLKLATLEASAKEFFGQLARLTLAVPASALGIYPQGNTGRSNVGMFQPMRISPEVQKKIKELEKLTLAKAKEGYPNPAPAPKIKFKRNT